MDISLQREFVAVMQILSKNGFKPALASGRDGHALSEPLDDTGVITMSALKGLEPNSGADALNPRPLAARLHRLYQNQDTSPWLIVVYGDEFLHAFEDKIAPAIAKIDSVMGVKIAPINQKQFEVTE